MLDAVIESAISVGFGSPKGPEAAKERIAKAVAFYKDLFAKAKIPQIQ